MSFQTQTLTTVHEQILKVGGLDGYQAAGRSMVRLNKLRTASEETLAKAQAATERAAERKTRADQKAASSTRASTQAVQAETAALRAAAREIQAKAAADERLAAAERRHAAAVARAERQIAARQNAIARRRTSVGAGASVSPAGITVGGVGVGAGSATAGVALLAGAQGIRDANGFEVALRDAGAAGEVTGRQLQRMGQITRRVGLETRVGALDATKAAGELVKAGSSVGDLARGQLKATLDLSRAGDVAADQAAITIAKVLGTFQKGVEESAHVADVITHTAGATTTSVDSMNQAFVQAAGAANLAKVPFEDLAAWLALLAKNGQEGSDAGTSIRTALTQLSSEKATKLLKERNIVLYDQNGQLKSLAELSDELGRGTEDLNAKQKTNYLQQLVGQDAYRSLAALISTNGRGVRSLSKELTEQGYAAKVAEQRTAGLEGQMRKLAAVRQEIAIATAGGLLPGLSAGAEAIADSLQSPGVQKALDRIGKQLGQEGEQLADGFARAAENGDLERFISGLTAGASAAADVTGDLVTVLGGIAKAYAAIPEPAREAATATLIYAMAARKAVKLVTGSDGRGNDGGGGSAGPAIQERVRNTVDGGRSRLEAARALGEQRRLLRQDQLAASAELAAARAELSRREARAAMYERQPSVTVDTFTGSRRRQRERQAQAAAEAAVRAEMAAGSARNAPLLESSRMRTLLALRAEREARDSLRTAPGRRAQLGELTSGLGSSLRGSGAVSGAVIGGVTGTLLAKDFLSAVVAGGAAGAIAGPWGAAGGAVASAAGYELKKYLQNKSKAEAAAFGREIGAAVTHQIGRGLSRDVRAQLEQLVADAERKTRKVQDEIDAQAPMGRNRNLPDQKSWDEAIAAQNRAGRAAGQAAVENAKSKQFQSTTALASDLLRRTDGRDRNFAESAARPYLAYVRELEKAGKLARGATKRFKNIVGQRIDVNNEATIRTQLRVDLRRDAGPKLIKQLQDRLKKNSDLSLSITVPTKTDLDVENLSKTAKRQRDELEKASRGRAGASKEERAAARKALEELDKLIAKYDEATKAARQRADEAGRLKRETDELRRANEQLRERKTLIETMPALPSLGEMAVDSTKPPKQKKAAGGAILGAGGLPVPVALSPGEVVRHAADGTWSRVPGVPISADSVHTYLQPNDQVFTFGGQALLGAGASIEDALALQPRHFYAAGGSVGPTRSAIAHRRAGFAGSSLVTATAISGAESGYRPGAVSPPNKDGSRDHGNDQINDRAHPRYFRVPGWIYEITNSAKAAWEISQHGRDFTPWTTYKNGAYRAKMNEARAAVIRSRTGSGDIGDQDVTVPRMVGRSRRGRQGLVADAFAQGYDRGASGYTADDLRQFGNPVMRQILEELAGGDYTRSTTARGRSGRSSTAGAGFGWPVSNHTVSSGFGPRRSPTAGASSYHDGVDFPVRVGTAVRAIANGTVTRAGANGGYGQYVGVQHAGGYFSGYGHLSKILTRQGSKVRRGQQIALSGNTGTSTGPHLHLQLHRNGQKIDPLTVLGQRMGSGGYVGRRRLAAGGTPNSQMRVGALGGVSVTAAIRGRGSGSIERLAAAAEDVSFRRVERTIAELQKVANAPGSKLVSNRARAAMSALEGTLGARVGRVVAQAGALTARRDTNLERTRQVQILRGIDPESARGIGGQMLEHQRFLDQAAATGQERQLEIAVERARRGDQRTKQGQETLRAAEEALEQFRDGVMTSRVALKDLEQQQRDAARSFREAMNDLDSQFAALTMTVDDDVAALRAQAAEAAANAAAESDPVKRRGFELAAAQASQQADRQARRSAFPELDFKAAEAALTKSTDDDRQVAQDRASAIAAAIADAFARGDRADITDLRNELASVNATLDTLSADLKARDDARQDIADRKARAAEMEARHLVGLDAGEAILAVLDQRLRPAADRLSGSPTRWMR